MRKNKDESALAVSVEAHPEYRKLHKAHAQLKTRYATMKSRLHEVERDYDAKLMKRITELNSAVEVERNMLQDQLKAMEEARDAAIRANEAGRGQLIDRLKQTTMRLRLTDKQLEIMTALAHDLVQAAEQNGLTVSVALTKKER